ncbi:MAG: Ig-like domain-containing protein, partial [Peptostreptococcaceae bacterium]
MKRRAYVYKRASAIMLSLMLASSATIGTFAENVNTKEPTKQETTKKENATQEKSTQPYIQNYDRPEGITWTHIKDNGTTEVSNGFLNITNQGDYRFIENETQALENGELEFRFQASKENTGRFGVIFRATKDNHAGIAYDSEDKWVVHNGKGQWENFTGPQIQPEDWVTVKVKYVGNHITVNINGQNYLDKVVDIVPLQEGKVGYRSWYNSKTTPVDYLKCGIVGSLGDGEIPEMVVDSIEPVKVSTFRKLKPKLPSRVKVKYSNGASGNVDVVWDYIEPSKYAVAGEFEVEGKVEGTDIKAVATVSVRGDAINYQPDYSLPENQGWNTIEGGG